MFGGTFQDIKLLVIPIGVFLLLGGALGVPYLITKKYFGYTLGGIEAGTQISHDQGLYALTVPDGTWAHLDEGIGFGFDTEIHGRDDAASAFVLWSCDAASSLDDIVRGRRDLISGELNRIHVSERRHLDPKLLAPVSRAKYSGLISFGYTKAYWVVTVVSGNLSVELVVSLTDGTEDDAEAVERLVDSFEVSGDEPCESA